MFVEGRECWKPVSPCGGWTVSDKVANGGRALPCASMAGKAWLSEICHVQSGCVWQGWRQERACHQCKCQTGVQQHGPAAWWLQLEHGRLTLAENPIRNLDWTP